MKLKLWIKYFIYTILLFLFIFLRGYFNKRNSDFFNITFQCNYFFLIISCIFGICTGLLLGLDYFLNELKKEGSWKINLPKLLLAGIPSLFFSLYYVFMYSRINFLHYIIGYTLLLISRYSTIYIPLFQLIFGYIMITSFYKNDKIDVPLEGDQQSEL